MQKNHDVYRKKCSVQLRKTVGVVASDPPPQVRARVNSFRDCFHHIYVTESYEGMILKACTESFESVMSKAGKMLVAVLMRSMHMPKCPYAVWFDNKTTLSAFDARIRSVLQCGSIIFSRAAIIHLTLLEQPRLPFSYVVTSQNAMERMPITPMDHLFSILKFFNTITNFMKTVIGSCQCHVFELSA